MYVNIIYIYNYVCVCDIYIYTYIYIMYIYICTNIFMCMVALMPMCAFVINNVYFLYLCIV